MFAGEDMSSFSYSIVAQNGLQQRMIHNNQFRKYKLNEQKTTS